MIKARSDILKCLGASLGVMYLLLGIVFVIFFILFNVNIFNQTSSSISPENSFLNLLISLTFAFLGFLSNLMLIVGAETFRFHLILPWIVFHMLFIIFLVPGGIILLFYFTIHQSKEKRAALCSIPIMSGVLLLFIWLKVYQEFIIIKKSSTMLLSRIPSFYHQNFQDRQQRQLSAYYQNPDQIDYEAEVIRNNPSKSNANILLLNSLGRSRRKFETLEASITFEEESELDHV